MTVAQTDFVFVDTRFDLNRTVRAEFGYYNNGRVAVQLKVHGDQADSFDGEPWAKATVNLPDLRLPAGKTTLKGWGENEGLPELMIKAGIVAPHEAGDPPEMHGFTPAALAVIARMSPFEGPAARTSRQASP